MKLHPNQMGHHRPRNYERVRYRTALPPHLLRVLVLTAEGLSHKEVAAKLGLSLKTAKNYRSALCKHFDPVQGTVALVIEAMRQGYVPCPHGCRVGHPPPRKPRPRRR